MDPWYILKCSACRSTLRIKSAYVHMRGQCPVCNTRIAAPVPKPLSFSDEPELMKEDVWPEPPQILSDKKEDELTYQVKDVGQGQPAPQAKEEEEAGGVYSLAFEPELSKMPAGVTRSAEWDQAQAPPSPAQTTAPARAPSSTASIPAPPPPPTKTVPTFKVEVDPLFGDEVKVPVESGEPPIAKPRVEVAKPVPVARLATQEDLKPQLAPAIALPPEPPVVLNKKTKKKPSSDTPSESFAHLDAPTKETHLYRLSDAEENRIKPDAPPQSIFMDGVFNFPWQPRNLIPWIWLTMYFSFIFMFLSVIQYIIDSGSTYAMIGAAGLGMAVFFVCVFAFAYGCACWSNTITYTAAGSRAVEWETEGWRENVIYLLRIGYYFGLAMMMATPLLVFNFIGIGTYLWLMGSLFIFPIFLFSGMASLTFWNFMHGDVIKKFIVKGHYYLVMYGIAVAMFAVAGVAIYFSMRFAWLVLISGPLFATAWLIYGRLLGRMAYLLQQEPKRKKKKKKKKKKVQEEAEEEGEPESVVASENEKGPREDARGPGGARPV